MKVTVVTVCLNAEASIEETIQSVINQNYDDFEYLILDGQSKDCTMKIISKYREVPYLRVRSEKDMGLYNAMNKGIELSRGEYIIFLNSGDMLVDGNVLKTVMEQASEEFVYGNVIRKYEKGMILERYSRRKNLFFLMLMGKMPCHQAIFTKRRLLEKYRFNEDYFICADFDFFVRVLKNKVKMQYVDIIISKVECVQGISSQEANLEEMRRQDDRSIRNNFPVWYYAVQAPKRGYRIIKELRKRK